MKPTPGLVASTLRSSMVDGPGNRYVLFLQGCNFDCVACHNPSTISRETPSNFTRTAGEVIDELHTVAPFISGITVSGGEPTQQL